MTRDEGMDFSLVYAQQIVGYGSKGDVLFALSTSGNSRNIIDALITSHSNPAVQEYHLPEYHPFVRL